MGDINGRYRRSTNHKSVLDQDPINRSLADEHSFKFPIGAQSFINLVTESNVFADKTLFIERIINLDDIYTLITRPRRWGKSLNLDMIKTFLEARIDENGNISNTKNKVFFEGGLYTNQDEVTTYLSH